LGLKNLKEICLQKISFSLDPDPDADPNQDLIKRLHPDPDPDPTLPDQVRSRSDTMLSTIQNVRDPIQNQHADFFIFLLFTLRNSLTKILYAFLVPLDR
jgi:hypothetical protein